MRPLIVSTLFLSLFLTLDYIRGTQILSKSKLEKCERVSDSGSLNCTRKIVINMAVPSESSGREASVVAEIVEVEENSTTDMKTIRDPPVITVNKSAAYALYQLTYIRDVAYKPEELYVQTRKCEPDAGADIVKNCERLRDEKGHIIEHTEEQKIKVSELDQYLGKVPLPICQEKIEKGNITMRINLTQYKYLHPELREFINE